MTIPRKKNYISKRCVWCKPPHLIDEHGNPMEGNATWPGNIYSDGMCKAAEKIENAKLDKLEAKGKKRI